MKSIPRLVILGIPLALLLILGLSQACTQTQAGQAVSAGVVAAFDCEASLDPATMADAKNFAEAKVQAWLGTAPVSLATLKAKILADLAPVKSNLGRCAIAGALAVIAAIATPTPTSGTATSALVAGPDPVGVRAVFSSAARELGWAPVKVGGSVL